MKKINTTLTIISLVLLCALVSFVGCSDMMATLGNISLTIDLDTPEVDVAAYTMEGSLLDSSSRFTLNNIVPPRHTLSELKEGRWNLTVKAFDDQDNQIGIGTKTVDLKAGQVVETSLLVEFRQSTPVLSTFTIAGPSRYDDREGSVAGTTTRMEYRLASAAADDPFTACTADTTQLVPGTYHIRLAQAHGLQASECLTFTVPAYQKIQLTIAAPTLTTTKEYDGTSTVQGSITPGALSGVRSGDEVVVHAQASYNSASVGNSKNITVAYSLSGADALNYTKPADTTIAGTISPKQLSISGTTVTTSKVYDGLTSATVENHGTLGGEVDGEVVTVTAHPVYQDRHAGTGKLISVSYTLGGAHAANYLAPANTSFSGAITKKALTVITPSIQLSKEYDGTPTAVVTTPGSLVGILSGDSVTLLESARYADKDVGSPKSITVSYVLTGSDADNYTAPQNYTFTTPGTIIARQLTATIGSYTKVYGEENPSFTINVSGFVNGENSSTADGYFTPTVSTTATTTSITGTYPITITGGSATNYSFNNSDIGTLTINKATYDMSGVSFNNSTVTYDGTEQSLLIAGTLPAGVSVFYTNNGKTNAGTYTVAAHFTGDSTNYNTIPDKTATLTINKATYDMSGVSFNNSTVTYDGTEQSLLIAGTLPAGVSVFYTNNGKTNAGTYTIAAHFTGDSTNYNTIPDKTASLTINKAVLTATVGDYTKSYGTTNPTFTVSVSGFVNGESALTASGYNAPIASSTATTTTSAGTTSTITISGGSAANYSFNTSDTGTLTINKAAISNDLAIFGGNSPKYGDVLTAIGNATLLGTPTYQWNRGGTAISGATAKTYTLTAADIGSTITVTAIADGINYEGSHTSWPTNTVSRIDGPSIDGAFSAYYPSSPATQTIINLTGFTPNLSGLEARVSLNGIQYDDYADLEIDSRGRAMILMSSSVTISANVQVRYKETATTNAGTVRDIPVAEQDLAVGDYYAGGVVGYIYQSSDPGYVAGQLHGLIAAKTDTTPRSMVWSSRDLKVGGTSTALGTGAANTTRIVDYFNSLGDEPTPYAAQAARDYTDGTYHDWFLPSFEELFKIRTNKAIIGNFQDSSVYWTSSESTQEPDPHDYGPTKCAHVLPFSTTSGTGWVNYKSPRNSSYTADEHVRPVRYF